LRLRPAGGTEPALAASIETLLLFFPRGRAIVSGTPLLGTLPAMVLSAAERTTQVLAADVPGIGEKANPAMAARNDATLQRGMGFEGGVQRDPILPD
jgi:hypothetical protein